MRTSVWAPSALVYTVLTAVLGRDVLAQIGTTIANDPGDPLLNAAILHWNAHHVPFTDAWWQFPIYHPTRHVLAFSEHLLGLSVIATPLAWITGNPLATYNLTLLLTFPLCGMAMFALVYHLTRSAGGAFIAGLAYAFAPYRAASLPHIQMLASFWAPLALLGLHRFIDSAGPARLLPAGPPSPLDAARDAPSRAENAAGAARGSWRWLALFGGGWALQAASNWYTLVLFSVLVALWILWFVVVPRRWRALGAIAAAIGVAALPLLPVIHQYITVHALHGFERSVVEMRVYSADVAAFLCAPAALTFWGWIRVVCRAEGELFPGVAVFALFIAAIFIVLRPGRGVLREREKGGRAGRILESTLLVVAALYTVVLLSVLAVGPWRVPLLGISVSDVDKPLLIALAAGVLALLIALAPHAWRRSGSAVSFYLFAAIVTWLLALGPTITLFGELSGRPGPFALLQFLPGVSGLRVPARFWLMTVLCLAVIAGHVAARLAARGGPVAAIALVGGVGAVLVADGWAARIPAQPPPPAVADAGALRNRVVLQLPLEPYTDIAATWRAVTGGWHSVNGYSGYAPNYYTALSAAARTGDAAMFAPFQRSGDLHVVVADGDEKLRDLAESQPGAVRLARGNGFIQYRLPGRARAVSRLDLQPVPLAELRSACASESVESARDGDERTQWECFDRDESHSLVADLGEARSIGAVVYSVGQYSWNVPTQLAIESSLDGTSWQIISRGSVLGAFIEGGLDDPSALRATVRFPLHVARYLRIRAVNQSDDFAWIVTEIEVHGT